MNEQAKGLTEKELDVFRRTGLVPLREGEPFDVKERICETINSLRTRLDQAEKDPRDRLPIRGEVYKRPNSTEAYFVTGTASGAHARTCVNIDVRTGITYETLLRTDVWPLDKWHDWVCQHGRLIGVATAVLARAGEETNG